MSSIRMHPVKLSSIAPKSCSLNTVDRAVSTYLWERKNWSPTLIIGAVGGLQHAREVPVQVRRQMRCFTTVTAHRIVKPCDSSLSLDFSMKSDQPQLLLCSVS